MLLVGVSAFHFFLQKDPFLTWHSFQNAIKTKVTRVTTSSQLPSNAKRKDLDKGNNSHPAGCDTLTQEVTPFLFAAEQEMTRSESQLRSEKKTARSVLVMWSESRNRAQGSVSNSLFPRPQFQMRINHWAFRVLLIREDLMGSHHCEITIVPLDIRPDVHFNPHQSSKAVWWQRWKRLKI